jgi:hypothetical protein
MKAPNSFKLKYGWSVQSTSSTEFPFAAKGISRIKSMSRMREDMGDEWREDAGFIIAIKRGI